MYSRQLDTNLECRRVKNGNTVLVEIDPKRFLKL